MADSTTTVQPSINGASPRDQIADILTGGPLSTGYRPTLPEWAYWAIDTVPQLYLLRDIELMLVHPVVYSALNFYKGGISLVEFEVDCDQPEAAEFAMEQCKRFWDRGVPLLQGGYEYGWIGLENLYDDSEGKLAWESLVQFSPRDCYLLTQEYRPVGIRIKNVRPKGTIDLWLASDDVPAKGLWYNHNPRYNQYYGQSQLMHCWRPWRRLAWKDGLETVIDHGLYRYAFTGPIIKYPDESVQPAASVGAPATTVDAQGRIIKHCRDIARQMAEWFKSGAGIGLPSTHYPSEMGGGPKWEADFPAHVLEVAPLIGAAKYLHDQIYYGIGVPPELLSAAESGSGYSGRAIPMEAFITQQQRLADAILYLFLNQVLRPLVRWNFGASVQFDVKVKPLLQTKRAAQGGQSNEKPREMPPEGTTMPGPGVGLPGQAEQPPGSESPYKGDNRTDLNKGGRGKTLYGQAGTQGPQFSLAEAEARVERIARKILGMAA
jgi:hypothetical protein